MLVTSSLDSIDLVLGSNVTTNQLHVTSYYNQITSTSVTPIKNVTTSSNTTPVNIVPSPSSGNQHQLRYCNIFNSDSTSETVEVRYNYNGTTRTVVSTSLQVNEYLQYTPKTGWKAFDVNGSVKSTDNFNTPHEFKFNKFFVGTTTNGSVTLTNNTPSAIYLGKATSAYKNIHIQHFVNSSYASNTWSELAVYKGVPSLGTNTTLKRVGFVDMRYAWWVASLKFATINVENNVTAGDDLWAVFAVSGSLGTLRGTTVGDDIGAGFVLTCGTARPSTSETLTGTVATASASPWTAWTGI